jgi:osmotically-inducible protein OsmY
MSRFLLRGAAVCVLIVGAALSAVGQKPDSDSDSIGNKIDRGVRKVESKLRDTWGDIKRGTHRMTVQGRVYARLYWDKSLADADFKIESRDEGVVVLSGSVADKHAKERAIELARSTVGVNDTIDELTVPAKTK